MDDDTERIPWHDHDNEDGKGDPPMPDLDELIRKSLMSNPVAQLAKAADDAWHILNHLSRDDPYNRPSVSDIRAARNKLSAALGKDDDHGE